MATIRATTESITQAPLSRIIELATRAPSVHNTQPWGWRWSDSGLELLADRARQLPHSDPSGRNLVISCGAALHHLRLAAAALGWATDVDRIPDGPDRSVLARIRFQPRRASETVESDLKAITDRCTDRRRFTSWPISDERLQHLADVAAAEDVHTVPLLTVYARLRAELLVMRALERQAGDANLTLEQEAWVDHSATDGMRSTLLGEDLSTAHGARSQHHALEPAIHEEPLITESDGVIVLCGESDDVAAWLKAGEGLSALWLTATTQGLSVVPLSQVVEVDETRLAMQQDVLRGLAHPLILVRIGWQPISRSMLRRTPRRPVHDLRTKVP